MRTIFSLFLVLLFVTGCGGGDGGSETVQVNPDPVDPVEEIEEIPMCSEILDERGAIRLDLLCNEDGSIIFETDGLFVDFNCILPNGGQSGWALDDEFIEGICAEGFNPHIFLPVGNGTEEPTPADETVDEPEREDEEESIERPGPTGDCHTQDELFAFLENVLACKTGHIHKWAGPPTIRVAAGAAQEERETVAKILERISLALPWELEIDPDDTPPKQPIVDTPIEYLIDGERASDAPFGEIRIEFAPRDEWPERIPKAHTTIVTEYAYDTLSYELLGGHIWLIRYNNPSLLLARMLLINLGVICSADSGWQYYGTVMSRLIDMERPPGDIDLDVLKAIYAHDIGDTPDFDLLPEELCDY